MSKPFNIRIYGLLIENNQLLVVREPFMGKLVYKFPGGGLEFGEGTVDCLKREFKEELNLDIEIDRHFHTQENFLQSALNPHEQILMIYYIVHAKNINQLKNLDEGIEKLIWIDLAELKVEDLSLEMDQWIVKSLLDELN